MTKSDTHQKARSILYAYPIGSQVSIEDAQFLLELLHNHPEANAKIGCGIKTFKVCQNPRNTNVRCFYLIRIDGSIDDFSISKCLTAPSPLAMFKSVCRNLISWHVYNFKIAYFEDCGEDGYALCPITNKWITPKNAHVDHIPPNTFEKLVTGFIDLYNINVENVKLKDAEVGKTFANINLADKWIAYHNKHAELRVVSAHANLSIIKKG